MKAATRYDRSAPGSSLLRTTALAALILGVALGDHGLSGDERGERLEYRFVPGDSATYDLAFRSQAVATLQSLVQSQATGGATAAVPPALAQELDLTIRGTLVVTAVEESADGFVLAYQLEHPSVAAGRRGEEAVTHSARIARDLERRTFVAMGRDGRVQSLLPGPDVHSGSEQILRALLGAIQVVLPPEGSPRTGWQVEELGASGPYVAQYTVGRDGYPEDSGECRRIGKRLTDSPSTGVASTPSPVLTARVTRLDSEFTACFSASKGELVSLQGSDRLEAALGGHAVGGSVTTVSMQRAGVRVLPAGAIAAMKQDRTARLGVAQAAPLFRPPSLEEIRQTARRSTLGDSTIEQLLHALVAAEAAGDSDTTELFLEFRALATLRPESCELLAEVLRHARPRRPTFNTLTDALAGAENPQAQEALASVIRSRRNEWEALQHLIPAVSLVELPGDAAVTVMQSLVSSSTDERIVSTAELALGTMARRMEVSSPSRAAGIIRPFVEELREDRSPERLRQLLLVLGNAGSDETLVAVRRFLAHPAASVRAAAVEALRFVPSTRAEDDLVAKLVSDPESAVRLAAVWALSFRRVGRRTNGAQVGILVNPNENEEVRLAVLKILMRSHDDSLDLRSLVEKLKKDPAQAVRDAVSTTNLVKGGPTPPM